MKVTYDEQKDVLRIVFRDTPVQRSGEGEPGVILDYDDAGQVVALELRDTSRRVDDPRKMEYTVTA